MFRWLRPHFPVQDHGREPNSDDELLLMGEVDVARTGLKADKHVAAVKEEEEKEGVKLKRDEGDGVPRKRKPRHNPAYPNRGY